MTRALAEIEIGIAEWSVQQLSVGWAPNTLVGEEHVGGDPVLFDDGSVAQSENGTYDDWQTEYAYFTHNGGLSRSWSNAPCLHERQPRTHVNTK